MMLLVVCQAATAYGNLVDNVVESVGVVKTQTWSNFRSKCRVTWFLVIHGGNGVVNEHLLYL